ncbi:predicted protein [Sclerotinia sclerotiorum 1980 UF-70]|uniref:Uncharacterized protein n=1 Tax=Sclerotinia sclerotiorum (strain ATCC 18683 / 1980 / Ss-1) TaxID=665079 RepID=A7E8M6_SCLS1|nr:predicted protein [Sclerotinia sclerotiorum 1980 UF-70]EDN96728.1 predicted protein [Sclerotinia sclerotiorum 1980 UF-70]
MVETLEMYISATKFLDTYWVGKEKKIRMEFVHKNSQPEAQDGAEPESVNI